MAKTRDDLTNPALYERQIRLLAERHRDRGWPAEIELTTPLVASHALDVSRRLAREVSAGEYAFEPLVPHAAMLNGKPRTIYRIDPLDAVVYGALVRVLTAAIEPRLGAYLHSYRKGYSQWTAARALIHHARTHAQSRPDPRERGLFVLRRDVRRYDENIPVGDDSSLWTTLERLLGGATLGYRGDLAGFLRRAFRPPVAREGAVPSPLARGVPTGLPTQSIACNVYLLPLDDELRALPGGFYARYGDDIVFAHHERDAVEHAARTVEAGVQRLGLQFNPEKSYAYWLTRPGRAHASAADYRPTTRVPYLGFEVGFDGARLRSDKRRMLWLGLQKRLLHADMLLRGQPLSERADALCHVVRVTFDRSSALGDRYASWLEMPMMSREDLRQLDYQIALLVAQRLSGQRGPRAFRSFPWRRLHESHGLPSLLHKYAVARAKVRAVTP